MAEWRRGARCAHSAKFSLVTPRQNGALAGGLTALCSCPGPACLRRFLGASWLNSRTQQGSSRTAGARDQLARRHKRFGLRSGSMSSKGAQPFSEEHIPRTVLKAACGRGCQACLCPESLKPTTRAGSSPLSPHDPLDWQALPQSRRLAVKISGYSPPNLFIKRPGGISVAARVRTYCAFLRSTQTARPSADLHHFLRASASGEVECDPVR